jgi:hypothetical protein
MALESSILNFRTMSLVYLAWRTNVPSFDSLISSSRKKCHHAHLKFPARVLCKPCNKGVRRATINNIIHAHLQNQDISALHEEKQGVIDFPHLKSLLKKEAPQPTVSSFRRLLQPIQHIPQLVHPVGVLLARKP